MIANKRHHCILLLLFGGKTSSQSAAAADVLNMCGLQWTLALIVVHVIAMHNVLVKHQYFNLYSRTGCVLLSVNRRKQKEKSKNLFVCIEKLFIIIWIFYLF